MDTLPIEDLWLAQLLVLETIESSSQQEDAQKRTNLKMRKNEHAGDKLTLMPDYAALTQKSERTNNQATLKIPWIVPWFKNWQTKAQLLERPQWLMYDLMIDGITDDQPLHGQGQRNKRSSDLYLAEQPIWR